MRNDLSVDNALNYARHISKLCEIGCEVMSYETRNFIDEKPPFFCSQVCALNNTEKCNCINTHLYGFYEAERWDKKYIYYCPDGLVFLANGIYGSNKRPSACLITGPVMMGELREISSMPDLLAAYEQRAISIMSPQQVHSLSEVVASLCDYISRSGEETELSGSSQGLLLNKIYDAAPAENTSKFFLECEKKLSACISSGDKKGSRELINIILGNLYLTTKGNLETIKARVAELIVMFSRAAIEGGAEADRVFWLNTGYLSDLKNFTTIEELNVWLNDIMHKYVSFVFDFAEIKHADVMFKIIEYVKEHYREKISLDDVANYVYLSKSYLSKIFNEEIGCAFTVYVNKIRCEKSKSYLLENKLSIVEIASIVGFEDQSYFTKTFKKIVGVSPGRFRETRGKI